jgi:hypothetical protein
MKHVAGARHIALPTGRLCAAFWSREAPLVRLPLPIPTLHPTDVDIVRVAGSARFVYASFARLAVIKFVHYMNASADVLALASIEVPITNIPPGGCIVVK